MIRILISLAIASQIVACSPKPENFGFALPEGSVDNGRLLFTDFKCYECHTFADAEFNDDKWRLTTDGGLAVELGGEKTYTQSYADLVTSVINPNHRIAEVEGADENELVYEDGESKMTYYNSHMTVQELIDIVTFLETKYELSYKPYTPYNPYTIIAPL